jgi:hypothetical protein
LTGHTQVHDQPASVVEGDQQVLSPSVDAGDHVPLGLDSGLEAVRGVAAGILYSSPGHERGQAPSDRLDLGQLGHGWQGSDRADAIGVGWSFRGPYELSVRADEVKVKPGTLALFVGGALSPLGVFRRRARDEWLGELADIRTDALGDHAAGLDERPHIERPDSAESMREVDPSGSISIDPSEVPDATEPEPDGEGEQGHHIEPPEVTEVGIGASGNTPRDSETAEVDEARPSRVQPAPDHRPEPHRERPSELWHPDLSIGLIPPEPPAHEERLSPGEVIVPDGGEASGQAVEHGSVSAGDLSLGGGSFDALGLGVGGDGDAGVDPADSAPPPYDVFDASDLGVEPAEPLIGSSPADWGVSPPIEPVASPDLPPARIPPPSDVFDVVPPQPKGIEPIPSRPIGNRFRISDGSLRGEDSHVATPAAAPAEGPESVGSMPPAPSGPMTTPTARRSLFGNPVPAPTGHPSVEPDDMSTTLDPSSAVDLGAVGVPSPPAIAGMDILDVRSDGTVAVEVGSIRLAPGLVREVSRLGGTIGLRVDAGWCWVASPAGAEPVLLTLTTGTLSIPAGTSALTVVEADGSVFVSVVRGTASLDRPVGSVQLGVGSIAQLSRDGTLHTDTATPEEMASDPVLTRNLLLDES